MSDKSGIEWTDATWNPTVGCTKVSAGCDHCYAETLVNRFAGTSAAFPTTFDIVNLRSDRFLSQPLRWRKPRRVFVNSLSDLFHKDVPDEFIARVFAVMAECPQHTFQLLTKRHGRMRSLLSSDEFRHEIAMQASDNAGEPPFEPCPTFHRVYDMWPLPNLWLGVSAEDQDTADLRVPALLGTPAAIRFLSVEPMLGPIDLDGPLDSTGRHRPHLTYWLTGRPGFDGPGATLSVGPHVDWVICGGESGAHSRPMDPAWARQLRDQCVLSGVPFLFKQWGGRTPKANGRTLDGRTWDEYPLANEATS